MFTTDPRGTDVYFYSLKSIERLIEKAYAIFDTRYCLPLTEWQWFRDNARPYEYLTQNEGAD